MQGVKTFTAVLAAGVLALSAGIAMAAGSQTPEASKAPEASKTTSKAREGKEVAADTAVRGEVMAIEPLPRHPP